MLVSICAMLIISQTYRKSPFASSEVERLIGGAPTLGVSTTLDTNGDLPGYLIARSACASELFPLPRRAGCGWSGCGAQAVK